MIDRGWWRTVRRAFWRPLLLVAASAVITGGLVVSASPSVAAGTAQVGYIAFGYGTSVSAPTAKEVQSKLWFNDGSWWGTLYNTTAKAFQIHRFDWPAQTWINTGVTVDSRVTTRHDALSDGNQLYVARGHQRDECQPVRQDPSLQLRSWCKEVLGGVGLPGHDLVERHAGGRHRQGHDRHDLGDLDAAGQGLGHPHDDRRQDLGPPVRPPGHELDWSARPGRVGRDRV